MSSLTQDAYQSIYTSPIIPTSLVFDADSNTMINSFRKYFLPKYDLFLNPENDIKYLPMVNSNGRVDNDHNLACGWDLFEWSFARSSLEQSIENFRLFCRDLYDGGIFLSLSDYVSHTNYKKPTHVFMLPCLNELEDLKPYLRFSRISIHNNTSLLHKPYNWSSNYNSLHLFSTLDSDSTQVSFVTTDTEGVTQHYNDILETTQNFKQISMQLESRRLYLIDTSQWRVINTTGSDVKIFEISLDPTILDTNILTDIVI